MTSEDARDFYAARIGRVLRYVGEHLDEPLSLDALAEVAGFSKFHFHRQFVAFTGMTVARFVSLMRMRRAAHQLAFDVDRQIIAIAYEAGFANPESFSRAFRKLQGQSPSQFRRAPEWAGWHDRFRAPRSPRPRPRSEAMTPRIVQFPKTRVAALEHLGTPADLMATVARFIAWRKSCSDSPEASSATYGVPYGDPADQAPDAFRFDVCGALHGPLRANTYGVVEKELPPGRCAVVRHHGSTDAIDATVHAMYRDWLPQSGERLRDFPVFFRYVDRVPRVQEHEQVTDVYLPLA